MKQSGVIDEARVISVKRKGGKDTGKDTQGRTDMRSCGIVLW